MAPNQPPTSAPQPPPPPPTGQPPTVVMVHGDGGPATAVMSPFPVSLSCQLTFHLDKMEMLILTRLGSHGLPTLWNGYHHKYSCADWTNDLDSLLGVSLF
jgi:hypothetical protein